MTFSDWSGETVAILGGGRSMREVDVSRLRGKCRVVAVNRTYLLAPWADVVFGADAAGMWAWCSSIGACDGLPRLYPGEPDALDCPGIKVTLDSPDLPDAHRPWLARAARAGIRIMRHRGNEWHTGLELEPGFVRGNNSIANVLSSIVPQSGAAKVLLLGLDMVRGETLPGGMTKDQHWHRAWPRAEPAYESRSKERKHRAAIEVDGQELELGWFEKEKSEGHEVGARDCERLYRDHIAKGCPHPPGYLLSGLIPRFATFAVELRRRGVEVINLNKGSAVRVFPFAELGEVL